MNGRSYDIAVVGGGLAGGLIALAMHRAHPAMRVALIEAGDSFGGNHRWSWFESDLDPQGTALLEAFPAKHWNGGNEVRFPTHSRQLDADYRSLASSDFDATLRRLLPQEAILAGTRVTALDAGSVTSETGSTIRAARVIDCREAPPSPHLTGGWQAFLGQHWRMTRPHGVVRPVIMDAAVEQIGGYRFMYLLPLGENDLFLEDTYYQDEPRLDRPVIEARIAQYVGERGWDGEVVHAETGMLPVITGGDFTAYRASLDQPGVTLAGARGGFVHPLTSYTVPIAVANALAIARAAETHDGPELARFVAERARRHWENTRFYRLLGRMLFGAAAPGERYRIFERFYRLPEPLIERFYAARSTPLDKLRILSGKPPVPIGKAVTALLGKSAPLVQGDRR
ncbi:lycopene beta-cyclase CrtY [Qipengyuania sp. MTN3-11]|uniref:lycopene beta-cyclase CrtY n=1 Tax=Qipengyuania sp. MTN3-11 TaxID=3056557 RepID=UPI0036F21E3E